jgi:hypothetical protein
VGLPGSSVTTQRIRSDYLGRTGGCGGSVKRYSVFVDSLQDLLDAGALHGYDKAIDQIDAALDGGASSELRRLVPLDLRQQEGAFFTGSRLARLTVEGFADTLTESSVVADPACGAGDLLLAAGASFAEAGLALGLERRLLGRDLQPAFVAAARLRLQLAERSGRFRASPHDSQPRYSLFCGLEVGSALGWVEGIGKASHLLLNPPFNATIAPVGCKWGSGSVNSAAVFLERCLRDARPGTWVQAILPDVLRGGARYRQWRREISQLAEVTRVQVFGRFDQHTDVDVFILSAQVTDQDVETSDGRRSDPWQQPSVAASVRDRFRLSVGAVVNNRDPHRGPESAYAVARGLPVWTTVSTITRRRRFAGTLHRPPFVVVRRTSSPSDRSRAGATIVNLDEPVAVDNHLIVLEPLTGGIDACQELMTILEAPRTNEWLNARIRCRHLTVEALSSVPWGG